MADELEVQTDKITVDPARLHIVELSQVRTNTWNPKDKDTKEYKQVYESIKANGLMGFIVVRTNPATIDGVEVQYEIIDGEQRFTACQELGYTKILVYDEGIVEDKRARELTIWWQAQVPFNELSLAKMVTSMIEQYGDIHSYFSEKQIEEMQQLAKFNFDQYQKAPQMPPPPTAELLKNFMVQLTSAQFDIVSQAIVKAKEQAQEEGTEVSDSRALELICADFIAS